MGGGGEGGGREGGRERGREGERERDRENKLCDFPKRPFQQIYAILKGAQN